MIGAGCVVALQAIAALHAYLEVFAFAHLNVEHHVVHATGRGVGREPGEGCCLAFGQHAGIVFALHAVVLHAALVARLSVETCDAELRCVLPHASVHFVDTWGEFVGGNGLV